MKIFQWLDKGLMKIEEFILSFSVILISVMVIGNVIAREVFQSGAFSFYAEVSRFAIIATTFMGIGYAARKGRHISMSAFYDFAPFKVRKVMMIIISLTTSILMFVMAYYTTSLVQYHHSTGALTTTLEVPTYYMSIAIPVGFFIAGLQFLRNTIINFTKKAKDKVYLGTDAVDYNDEEKGGEIKAEDVSSV